MTLYDRDLIDALCRNTIGKPAAVCTWQDLLRVREVVDELLNLEIDRRQNESQDSASTSPARESHVNPLSGSKAASASLSSRTDLPAPNLPGATAPVVAPGSTTDPYQPPPAA